MLHLNYISIKVKEKKNTQGLPQGLGGKESACECRRHGFDPWSGKVAHAEEQLGPWATSPWAHSRWAHVLEPGRRNYWSQGTLEPRALQQEKLDTRNRQYSLLVKTREKPEPQQRPNTDINKQNFFLNSWKQSNNNKAVTGKVGETVTAQTVTAT